MDFAPFRDQPINALGPDDGQYQEYAAWNIKQVVRDETELPMGLHLVYRAIYEAIVMKITHPKFSSASDLMDFETGDIQVIHFRRVCDRYDISRVTLLGHPDTGIGGPCSYVYVVLGIERKSDGETFKLRGVSYPQPVLTPQTGWCNSRENWYLWSED